MARAVYPGSFDPFHYGHLEITTRASKLFDEVVVAIYANPAKRLLFSIEERTEMVQHMVQDLLNVSVTHYSGLTVDCARNIGADVMVRGLRNLADFQAEQQLAWANGHLAQEVDTCCLYSSNKLAYLSSSILKEVAALNGNYSEWTSPYVQQKLREVYAARAEK